MVHTAAGLPARGVEVVSSDSRHRPQSARVQHRCPGHARGSTVPAGWVFSLKATWLVSSTGRPAVGSAATTPRSPGRPHNQAWKLWQRCSTARLVSRALLVIPLSHNVNGTRSDCSHYICSRGLYPLRLPHGSRRRGAPLIDYGAVTMGYYRGTTGRPYSARRTTIDNVGMASIPGFMTCLYRITVEVNVK
jgi:hypothetical protein